MDDVDLELSSSIPITPRQNNSLGPTPLRSAPVTPPRMSVGASPYIISAPQSQFHSPSLSRSPLLHTPDHPVPAPKTPNKSISGTPTVKTPTNKSRNITPRFLTPLGSPLRKALHLTKLDPQDAWLPITESRNGNAYYAAFHTLCSGIGIQALVLPVAFTILGWSVSTYLPTCLLQHTHIYVVLQLIYNNFPLIYTIN